MRKENLSKRIVLVIIGQLFISAGVSLLLYINLGADPMGVFHTGVSNALNVPFAIALFIENITVLVLVYFIDKSYIHIATLLTLFVVSMTTNFFTAIFMWLIPIEASFIIRIILLLVACLLISMGLNFYVLPDLGVGPLDVMVEMIVDKKGFAYQNVKVLADLLYLGVGFALGGVVGIGTVISAFVVGPMIQFTRKHMKDPIFKYIGG
jgi:uncharacterized protein